MAEQMWLRIIGPLLAGLVLSFALELLLKPRPVAPWQRHCKPLMLHTGTWLLLYSPLLLLFRRPCFASALLVVILFFVILVSNAKHHSLREPFIYQDFSYFVDALRFPRLYLPFLGMWSGIAVALAVMVSVTAGMFLEQPAALLLTSVASTGALLTGAALTLLGVMNRPTLQLNPATDMTRLGLIPNLWHYGLAERETWKGEETAPFSAASQQTKEILPNLVAIQSESFFDPRRWLSTINPDLLQQFDELKQTAVSHGVLEVPAWGANTVRTEFAFLSGIDNDQLGIHRFKPYRRLPRQRVPALPGFLKMLGYRTVCIHPYSARFYGRNKVFPLMGFDEFIDISRFDAADYVGQYVGDAAVARELCKELARHDKSAPKPIFLFVITMENHGPLHLETVNEEDRNRFYTTSQPEKCADLSVYLRHLHHADQMLGTVRKQLEFMDRESWLCLYGDHLPIMPEVYRRLGCPDGTVDYLLWNNRQSAHGHASDLRVEQLPVLLAELMGLPLQHKNSAGVAP